MHQDGGMSLREYHDISIFFYTHWDGRQIVRKRKPNKLILYLEFLELIYFVLCLQHMEWR